MTIQLPQEVEQALNTFAERSDRSREQIVTEAVVEFLSEQRDAEIALERLQELREGKSYTIPLAEVMERYGVER